MPAAAAVMMAVDAAAAVLAAITLSPVRDVYKRQVWHRYSQHHPTGPYFAVKCIYVYRRTKICGRCHCHP